jgi:cobalamin biosynthesis Mg chelatase CobN
MYCTQMHALMHALTTTHCSWRKDGVQGLQQVVLYSLPELDGAIDTVVLGGLVGDAIALVPERTRKLTKVLLNSYM